MTFRQLFFFLTLSAANFGNLNAQPRGSFDAAWEEVRKFYLSSLKKNGIIGSSLMMIHEGRAIESEFYGFADKEEYRAVDENTIYHWASITKTFTGIAIMQLRDRGLLSLDDPVIEYIPELKAVHNPFGDMNEITIRHIMSHSAGFRAPTWPWGGSEAWHPHEPLHWEQLVAMFPYTEIKFKPGSQYSYSNPGIIFLGRIIELVTTDDYEVYIDKNILKPLKMYNSYFDNTPYHLTQYRSNNYYVENGKVKANGLEINTGITVSNGGLNAPLTDMIKYINFLTGEPEGNDMYENILRRASLEEMWQSRVEVRENESCGLVFFQIRRGSLEFIGHTGSQKGFISFFYIVPQSKTGCIAAFNTLGVSSHGRAIPDTRALSEAVRETIFEKIFPLFE